MRNAADIPSSVVERSEAARWAACFVAVGALHCAFAIAVFANWDSVAPGAPPAVMIELAALPAAPSSQPSEAPPGPEATANEAQPEPKEKPQETMTPPVAQSAETEPKPVEQAELKRDIEPEPLQIPELLPAPKPEIAIAVPPPVREKKQEPKKRAEKKPSPQEKKPPSRASPSTTAPQSAATAAQQTASIASAGRNASMPDWRNRIVAHLQRNKRFPAGVQAGGTASVRFTIDRNGRVLSSGLAGGSGISVLDSEAVAMISRSNPFPAAPADVTGGPFSFSVPVRFTQR